MMSLQRANVYLLQINVYSNPLLTFKLGLSFFYSWVVLYIFYTQDPDQMYWHANFFSHFVGFLFTFLIVSFSAQKFLILMKYNLSTFWLLVLLASYLRKYLSNSISQRFTPILSSKTFIALPFTFRYLISSELIFICDYGSKCSLLYK